MEVLNIFDLFQKKGLLPSIGGSDDIYQKLKKSAKDITTNLIQNKDKIIPYTLVAFDNLVQETEPILAEVETSIAQNWQMLRSQFSEIPIALYRAVMLQALENLVVAKPAENYAAIIWWSIVDTYPHLNVPQREKDLLQIFLHQLGNQVEDNAIKEWSVDKQPQIQLPVLSFQSKKTNPAVDVKQLTEFMIAASGPQGTDGVARQNSNRYWSNGGANWCYEFAPIAAQGIASVVNNALTQQNNGVNQNIGTLQNALNNYFEQLGKNIKTALQGTIQSAVAVEQRSQLLWWKETLYSRKLQKSYRKLNKFECAIAMAWDLYLMLPDIFPVSVDYILQESFCQIHGHEAEKITIQQFVQYVNDEANSDFLKQYVDNTIVSEKRITLVELMSIIIYTKTNITQEIMRLGIAPDKQLSYEAFSVWILHNLASKHLIAS